jgi:hypothetical protein
MRFPASTMITKEWVREHCKCFNDDGRLLCQESCPVHNTINDVSKAARIAINEATEELGWNLLWYFDKEKQS